MFTRRQILQASAAALILPAALTRRMHELGVPLLGLRTSVRLAALALVSAAGVATIIGAEYKLRNFVPRSTPVQLQRVSMPLAKGGLIALTSPEIAQPGTEAQPAPMEPYAGKIAA